MLTLSAACAPAPPAPAALGPPLVLLVSLDTTRADAVGCTAAADAQAPVLAALAAEGACAELALSSASTTLAAHAAVFSGLDSHGHGVPRNGVPLSPTVPLWPERLRAAGWQTFASVGSYALARDVGLARAFDAYEDHGGWRRWFGLYEVGAERVTDTALELIDARDPARPTLLFVHYYDAHMPWDSAPADLVRAHTDPTYAGRVDGQREGIGYLTDATLQGQLSPADRAHARGLYLAEVAWVDQQLGRLQEGLRERGLAADAWTIVFADHGEMFDEEPARPWRHGPDVDLPVLHVPLIVHGPGLPPRRVPGPLRTQDIGPTLGALIGVDLGVGAAVDRSAALRGQPELGPPPPAFAEASKPVEEVAPSGWPNRRLEVAVAHGGHLLTRAPWLAEERLFALRPDQPPAADPAAAAALGALLDGWAARAPGFDDPGLSPEARAALEALGYLED